MITTVDENTPTSDLLEIKQNTLIADNTGTSGLVEKVEVANTDEFWLFTFYLADGKQIEIRKIKNIC